MTKTFPERFIFHKRYEFSDSKICGIQRWKIFIKIAELKVKDAKGKQRERERITKELEI